jgi:hypothetical protein
MSRRIKKLDEYKINEDFDIGSILSSIFPVLGSSFQDTIKTKIAATLLEKIGLVENSLLSSFFQEFVAEIPIADYSKILSGESDANYWAPKMTDFARRFVERKGIDTIAEKMGIKPDGLAYTYFRNLILSKEGQQKMTSFFHQLIGSSNIGQEAMSSLDPNDKNKLTDIISKRMDRSGSSGSYGTNPWELVKTFFGGMQKS